jgi:uncharacterized protein YgbK (DUF1537 family)
MIVIADDITGAAEIAGIAHAHGQQARLVCACPADGESGSIYCDSVAVTTVIATDTRSMSEADAAAEIRRIASSFLISHSSFLIFKKTDSALRGHVVAELSALMQTTGYQRAVYLPANPSKGRIIRNGVYYIKEASGKGQEVREVPIHETAFSYDPEFPAKTSVLKERFPDAEAKGIIMPDAESEADIRKVIQQYDDGKTIFAGAADLFSAIIPISPISPIGLISPISPIGLISPISLILCGSTQSKPLDLGIPIAPMPREVYDGEQGADYWFQSLTSPLSAQASSPTKGPLSSLILTIPHTHRTGKETAVHLRTVMAEMAQRLVSRHCPDHLIIEGGATAWATLQALGWTDFQIKRQIAPGVVQMSATNGTLVTLKPGSYSWGGLF